MNTEKLYCELLDDKEIKDIPVIFIIRVACSVLKIIDEGKCFNETEV